MKRFIQLIIFALVLAFCAPVSYACFCVKPDVPAAFKQARVVFVGEVLEVIPPLGPTGEFVKDSHVVKFNVEQAWKGTFLTTATALVRWNNCFGLRMAPQKESAILSMQTLFQ